MIWLQNQSNLAIIQTLDQRAARDQVSNFLFVHFCGSQTSHCRCHVLDAGAWPLWQSHFKEPTIRNFHQFTVIITGLPFVCDLCEQFYQQLSLNLTAFENNSG